jgi:predicted metal-binding protein
MKQTIFPFLTIFECSRCESVSQEPRRANAACCVLQQLQSLVNTLMRAEKLGVIRARRAL